jgi:hypothetical protein
VKQTTPYLLLLLLASCERVSEYTGPLPDLKLVLYSFARPDSMLRVDVHQTRYFSREQGERPANVSGEVYINGEQAGTLRPAGLPAWDYLPSHETGVFPRPGDRVKIVARADGLPEASAEVTLPADTVPVRVDTLLVGPATKIEGIRFIIRVDDKARERRYYRLVIETETYQEVDGERFPSSRLYSFSPDNDPLLVGGNNTWINEEIVPNRYRVFTNESFEGEGYTMRVSAASRNSTRLEYDHQGVRVVQRDVTRHHVRVIRLDEDTYLHLKSIMLLEMGEGVMEPVQVHANVRGGAGIVGYACHSTATFEMPEVAWEETPGYTY